MSNYISTRGIDTLHITHTDYVFGFLEELKKRHPQLNVIVTMFNDRVAHFEKSLHYKNDVDIYLTDNDLTSRHFRQELGDDKRVEVIPNGIDSHSTFNLKLFDRLGERDALGINDQDLAVFFIGRLSSEKNPDVFVKVAEEIISANQADRLKFFVIGDGVMRPGIEKEINRMASDKISYLGYQSDVAKYLSAADIFVLPSSIEGFPLSILEAMAMEVAVIASDVGAVSDVIQTGKDGFVVAPGSVGEITKTISQLRDDPILIASVKSNARQSVEKKYSNTILGDNYKKLYNSFVKKDG